jgi:hypothetical protein
VVGLALLVLGACGASASAETMQVTREGDALLVTGTAGVESLQAHDDGYQLTISGAAVHLASVPPGCVLDDEIRCPLPSHLTIDVGGGDDRLYAPNPTTPVTIDDGPGNDDLGAGG